MSGGRVIPLLTGHLSRFGLDCTCYTAVRSRSLYQRENGVADRGGDHVDAGAGSGSAAAAFWWARSWSSKSMNKISLSFYLIKHIFNCLSTWGHFFIN